MKAAVSNSLTIFPLAKVPRSPPRLPDGQRESSLAMFANFSPLLRRSKTVLASCSVFTRMWAQWTLSGMISELMVRFIMFPFVTNRFDRSGQGQMFAKLPYQSVVNLRILRLFMFFDVSLVGILSFFG